LETPPGSAPAAFSFLQPSLSAAASSQEAAIRREKACTSALIAVAAIILKHAAPHEAGTTPQKTAKHEGET
jgi:hypothetical protein